MAPGDSYAIPGPWRRIAHRWDDCFGATIDPQNAACVYLCIAEGVPSPGATECRCRTDMDSTRDPAVRPPEAALASNPRIQTWSTRPGSSKASGGVRHDDRLAVVRGHRPTH